MKQIRRGFVVLFATALALTGCGSDPAAPTATSLTAAASPIVTGDSTTLTPVFANGAGNIDQGVGVVASGTAYTVRPTADTTYTLTVVNGAGVTITKTVTVQVVPRQATPVVLAPATVVTGRGGYTAAVAAQSGVTYAWSIDDAHSAITAGDGTNAITFQAGDPGAMVITCTVTNAAGTSVQGQAAVTVTPILAFTARGGKGLAGDGGRGGTLDVEAYGTDVRVVTAGAVNTDVALPGDLPYLGGNWVDVTADTTLGLGTSGLHLVAGDPAVYNDTGRVTGLRVRPGVTLTIQPNFDTDNADADWNAATGTLDAALLDLSDGVIVEGTIKVARRDLSAQADGVGADTADLQMPNGNGGGLYVAATGKIDLSGAASAEGAGGNGGSFLWTPSAYNIAGVITTAGGAGATAGGRGGQLRIYTTNGYAVSTGTFHSDGGAGGSGRGGDAGYLDLESSNGYGYLVAKGLYSAGGGSGADGGEGAPIYFYTDWGAMVLDGTFRSPGGDATTGAAGSGGVFYVDAYGTVRVAGAVDNHGGSSAGAGDGGAGGGVEVHAYDNEAWGSGGYEPNAATAAFGASVNASGGDGANGGPAGGFYLENDDGSATAPGKSPVLLVGYARLDLSGGDGHVNGGPASGYAYLDAWNDGAASSRVAGSVYNEADIVLRGGDGETGAGGRAAYAFYLQTESELYPPYDYGVTSSGALDASGGRGATYGGDAGEVYLYGKTFVTSTGPIAANGGKGGSGGGGAGGEIELYSDLSLTSAGALSVNGGDADASAGWGGALYLNAANTATVTGAISAKGGSSVAGAGGDGGYLWILSQDAASQVTGAWSVAPGTGAADAPAPLGGSAYIDGMQVLGNGLSPGRS